MVAYQAESDLLDFLRPHYARADDEGRTLIRSTLQSTAALAPREARLAVTLAPLGSPHRSRAIAAEGVCQEVWNPPVFFGGSLAGLSITTTRHMTQTRR